MTAAAQVQQHVATRQANIDDLPFIFATWMRSYRREVRVSGPIYFHFQRRLITRLVERSRVVVVCDSEDPTHLLGYIVAEPLGGLLVVHFAYIKSTYRRLGLASSLIREARIGAGLGMQHSHSTDDGERLAARFKSVFNPYLGAQS